MTKQNSIWYGGDYYPEQWSEDVWQEDDRLFQLAGINLATINVFAWALNQPSEFEYRFDWLDKTVQRLNEKGVSLCMGTGTAALPAWMARQYPEVLRVDRQGRKHRFGQRANACPNSPVYQRFAAQMAGEIAKRYKANPAIVLWHVNNEYGGTCYCENCEKAFRQWLKKRYKTLDALNRAWNTRFWSHTFYDWDEIVVPNCLSEELERENDTTQPSISLDYRRFNSHSMHECYLKEREAILHFRPDAQITTNMMGLYPVVDLNPFAKDVDVVAWDCYPAYDTPPSYTAMQHDLMRGLKRQPFWLMEQTPSQQNWQAYNSLKQPGLLRLESYQAVAHGADAILFFQLRQSIGGCEKFHGAVISHAGNEHTRVFQECAALGKELKQLGNTLPDARSNPKAAVLYDWENRWAIELSSGPSIDLHYENEVHKYYRALYARHYMTDVVGFEWDFSQYKVIIAPVLYMVKEGMAQRLEAFVRRGGCLVITFFSGIVDESDLVTTGGYPGKLRSLAGVFAEELDALPPQSKNSIIMNSPWGELKGEYTCGLLCDLIHAETAQVMATYGDHFYAGRPALTCNHYGKGKVYYVATSPEDLFLEQLLSNLCLEAGIKPLLPTPAPGIEAFERTKDDKRYLFLLNHTAQPITLTLYATDYIDLLTTAHHDNELTLEGYGVAILTAI